MPKTDLSSSESTSGKRKGKKVMPVLILLAYGFFTVLMLQITLQYVPYNTDVAFLRIKQDYIGMTHYKIAFFLHVYTSLLVLPAAVTQFLPVFRKRWPKVHRWGGWLYAGIVLLAAGPSGLIIGIYANGGIWSQIAFCTLGVLWLLFTGLAVWKIRSKDFFAHRNWMIRSFALAMSAITLRAWKYLIVAVFHPRPMDVYMIVAWLGWTLNLVIAEIIIFKLNQSHRKKRKT